MKKNILRSKSNLLKKNKSYILLLVKKTISSHIKKSRKINSLRKKTKNYFRNLSNKKNSVNKKFKKLKKLERNLKNQKIDLELKSNLKKNRKIELTVKKNLNLKIKKFKYLKNKNLQKEKKIIVFKSRRSTQSFLLYKNEKEKIDFNNVKNKLCDIKIDEDNDSDEEIINLGVKKMIDIFCKYNKHIKNKKKKIKA